MKRRRRKRNPDAATSLAAVGGFLGAPIVSNVIGLVSSSPTVGIVASGVGAGFAIDAARSAHGPARAGWWGAAAGCTLGMFSWWMISRMKVGPNLIRTTNDQGQPAPATFGPPPTYGGPSPQAQWLAFPPQAKQVPLAPGVRYRAAIDLPFGVGALATDARVKEKAAEMGFTDVQIVDDAGWHDDGDLFVEATYAGAPRWLERNERIVGAWAFV